MNISANRSLFLLLAISYLLGCKEDESVVDRTVYREDGEVQVLFENAPEGINVIFLGDGFTQFGLRAGGNYERLGTRIIDYLFDVPPFSTYQQYFNAYIVYAESAQGFTTDKTLERNTAFGTTWDKTLDRRLLTNASTCTDLDPAWFVEYSANVDDIDNLDSIKWSHLIGRAGYKAVGAYEGGSYVSKDIWRPEYTSIMNDILLNHFNAPSREAIVKRILEIRGIPYQLDELLANDVIPMVSNSRIHHRNAQILFGCQRP